MKDENAGSATNYPSPRHAGITEWFREIFDKMRNKRTARGAYEETGPRENLYRGGTRGRDGEDDAWDPRVGGRDEEMYAAGGDRSGYGGYEEQELGLAPSGYEEVGANRGRQNPFGDENAAPSLRSVSPRPESQGHTRGQESITSTGSGGGGTKKSAFREGI
jgi:hypothetical protein